MTESHSEMGTRLLWAFVPSGQQKGSETVKFIHYVMLLNILNFVITLIKKQKSLTFIYHLTIISYQSVISYVISIIPHLQSCHVTGSDSHLVCWCLWWGHLEHFLGSCWGHSQGQCFADLSMALQGRILRESKDKLGFTESGKYCPAAY